MWTSTASSKKIDLWTKEAKSEQISQLAYVKYFDIIIANQADQGRIRNFSIKFI
jgi:hypothetical protein